MLSVQELAAIPLFAGLPPAALADLARSAADIRLNAGEYATHEGDEPALYVVLAGAFDVIKLVDGIERKIGTRPAGKLFGEVPLIYGTQFQAGFRASEPSRLLSVAAPQYYALAALSPDLATAMRDQARERIGGLQGLVAEPRKARVTLVGRRFDPACLDVRRFLTRNHISFDWLTPDDPDIASRWAAPLPAEDQCPTLRLADGAIVVRPQPRRMADLLGLQTAPARSDYDTVIVGGGPAGLAAAVYGASEGLRTAVIECEAPGGQAETSSRIENYLGFPNGISGDELASRALRQARRLGAEIIVSRRATGIDPLARAVALDGGDRIGARTVILATGVAWRRLAIDGFDRLIGKGVYYGAARSEAPTSQGRDIHLIGAGNSAGQAAMFFANHARTVTLVVRGEALEKSMSQYLIDQIRSKANIRVLLRSEVTAVAGEASLSGVSIAGPDGAVHEEESGGVFVFIGADAETGWLPDAVARDPRGYILTGADVLKAGRWREAREPYLVETSVPGIFACGDVRFSPVKRVASAVGEGSMAIAFVHQYLAGLAASA